MDAGGLFCFITVFMYPMNSPNYQETTHYLVKEPRFLLSFSASIFEMEQTHWTPGGFMEDSCAHKFLTSQAIQAVVPADAVKASRLELRPKKTVGLSL